MSIESFNASSKAGLVYGIVPEWVAARRPLKPTKAGWKFIKELVPNISIV